MLPSVVNAAAPETAKPALSCAILPSPSTLTSKVVARISPRPIAFLAAKTTFEPTTLTFPTKSLPVESKVTRSLTAVNWELPDTATTLPKIWRIPPSLRASTDSSFTSIEPSQVSLLFFRTRVSASTETLFWNSLDTESN